MSLPDEPTTEGAHLISCSDGQNGTERKRDGSGVPSPRGGGGRHGNSGLVHGRVKPMKRTGAGRGGACVCCDQTEQTHPSCMDRGRAPGPRRGVMLPHKLTALMITGWAFRSMHLPAAWKKNIQGT